MSWGYWLPFVLLTICRVASPAWADDDQMFFAVVSAVPKDKTRVSAKVLSDGAVSDLKLIPGDAVVGNPVWRTLEVCHALKIEGVRIAEGLKVLSAKVLDASMLPMALQGYAGDCLIKKAVEIAPLAD
ncbi:MAG TPA: hypothetical protein PKV55_13555 [Nitrospira sp.]|jgi:hypothetical protein|nr:hypothetical protein [Nitrospira sp.]MCC7472520.1 hypothetical protein [Candidatus Nomurabacteria bacterium]MBS0158304.1 hypothetical protein [Nitrospira sp.]MBS0161948.1 hypothetical protein [Nitrospira sp.]MBS0174412.1 hypothetical protein [Nitrospira sp.]